jgi:hypothetical protein
MLSAPDREHKSKKVIGKMDGRTQKRIGTFSQNLNNPLPLLPLKRFPPAGT